MWIICIDKWHWYIKQNKKKEKKEEEESKEDRKDREDNEILVQMLIKFLLLAQTIPHHIGKDTYIAAIHFFLYWLLNLRKSKSSKY